MFEKVKLICGLIRKCFNTMEPYQELLGDGVSPIFEGWYNSIEEVGVYLGLTEKQIDCCWDYEIYGKVSFVLDNGMDYTACTVGQLAYALGH